MNLFVSILIDSFHMDDVEELKFTNGFPELFKIFMLEEQVIKEKSKRII